MKIEFKRYIHGISDAGTRFLFKFWSETHELNEELGRHRGRNGKTGCTLCDAECESVVHVLWECPVYKGSRDTLMAKLKNLLGKTLKGFDSLSDITRV